MTPVFIQNVHSLYNKKNNGKHGNKHKWELFLTLKSCQGNPNPICVILRWCEEIIRKNYE